MAQRAEAVITPFRKAGCQPITIPKHEPIKKVYVEMVKQIVESEAVNGENVVNYFAMIIVWKL